jgi:hypothetical protein
VLKAVREIMICAGGTIELGLLGTASYKHELRIVFPDFLLDSTTFCFEPDLKLTR